MYGGVIMLLLMELQVSLRDYNKPASSGMCNCASFCVAAGSLAILASRKMKKLILQLRLSCVIKVTGVFKIGDSCSFRTVRWPNKSPVFTAELHAPVICCTNRYIIVFWCFIVLCKRFAVEKTNAELVQRFNIENTFLIVSSKYIVMLDS